MRYLVNVATSLWKEIRLLQQRSGIPDPLASKKYSGPDPCQWLMMLHLAAPCVWEQSEMCTDTGVRAA